VRASVLFCLLLSTPATLPAAPQSPTGPPARSDPVTAPVMAPGDPRIEYLRYLQLTGRAPLEPLMILPLASRAATRVEGRGPWGAFFGTTRGTRTFGPIQIGLTPVRLRAVFNSDFPDAGNDGALWAGRGISSSLEAGLFATLSPVSVQFAPVVHFSQNRDFDTVPMDEAGYSEFIYPWHPKRIDLPQRFGTDQVRGIDWGQSAVAMTVAGIRARYGTMNLHWGPARYNPIIMSENAPGFPHFSLGSAEPFRLLGSRWEVSALWGTLRESDFFDDDPDNDRRYLSAFVGDVQPAFLPGLTLGGARVFYQYFPEDGLRPADYLRFLETLWKWSRRTSDNPSGEDDRDQLLSLFGRWVFPESGFEVYAEWARNDHSADLRDFIRQPDHSRAWTIGFQKALGGARAEYLLGAELTQLGRNMTAQVRPTPVYYTHHKVIHGYTHLGQMIGAMIGPGSESQRFELTRFTAQGATRLAFTRVRWDNDYYFEAMAPTTWNANDISNTLSLEQAVFLGSFLLSAEVAWIWRLNRNFILGRDAHNLRLQLSLGRY